MVASNIKVFIRVRPSARPAKGAVVDADSGLLNIDIEKRSADGQVDNTKTHFKFKFDGILPMQVSQQQVFEHIAKPVVDDVLQGINGTIFAYGQTGSGKTFTITGGAESYEDRGLIPRTIRYLFDSFKKSDSCKYSLYISYLEIYNNDGYDLLSRDDAAKLEDLPKVMLREDEEGNIKLRNLSVNMAQKEEDALNLLFLGDTNRVVAETPMNDASTRSHCLFIIWVESSQVGSDTVRRAKLHLVDLAGSERIGKTGVEGKLRTEATSINLSLHFLEQVIVALNDRSQGRRQHVPYRNSILTSVLRDSLGGNCRTLMVGTVAVEESNLEESISTCRFAQRVACIKNNAIVNEELDPALMIRRLKKEVSQLKDELAMLAGDDDSEVLTEADLEDCRRLVTVYLEETDVDAPFVCGSTKRFQASFDILRRVYWERECDGNSAAPATDSVDKTGGEPAVGSLEAAVAELRQQVCRRDEEIGMLLNSINKRSSKGRSMMSDTPVFIKGNRQPQEPSSAAEAAPDPPRPQGAGAQGGRGGNDPSSSQQIAESAALLLDRNKAFEVFRKSVRRRQGLQESHEHQAALVEEAKKCGLAANAAREAINTRKTKIEKLRMERAMASNPRDQVAEAVASECPEARQLLNEIEEQKRLYQQNTERLRQVKAEIDSYKHAKQQSEERMRKDFEAWYKSICASQGLQVDIGGAESSTETDISSSAAVAPCERDRGASSACRSSASVSSSRSDADSSARATPAVGARQPPSVAAASVPARSSDEQAPPQTVNAWVASVSSHGAQSGGPSTSASPPASASGKQLAPATPPPPPVVPKSVQMTGDQKTDDSIIALYEALAALNG